MDDKRLDWLESVSGKFYGVGYPDGDKVVLEWDTDDSEGSLEANTLREAIDMAMSGKGLKSRLLTGRELRVAAKKKLKVRYVETYHNPHDSDKDYDSICVMEEANVGYYIGNSDIEPDVFSDSEDVQGDFDEGTYAVYAVDDVEYK